MCVPPNGVFFIVKVPWPNTFFADAGADDAVNAGENVDAVEAADSCAAQTVDVIREAPPRLAQKAFGHCP